MMTLCNDTWCDDFTQCCFPLPRAFSAGARVVIWVMPWGTKGPLALGRVLCAGAVSHLNGSRHSAPAAGQKRAPLLGEACSTRVTEARQRGPGPSLCHQLGIRALLGPPSEAQRGPRRLTLVASGAGCGRQGRHKGSVDGKLSAAPHGQAIGNDFNAAVVAGHTNDLQVPDQRVHADGGTSPSRHGRTRRPHPPTRRSRRAWFA